MIGTVFIKLLNMSIAAGWIVLAVVLIRLVFKKAPKWMRCLLWAVVALRLILPVFPESPVSLMPSKQTIIISESASSGKEGPADTIIHPYSPTETKYDPDDVSDTFSNMDITTGIYALNYAINPVVDSAIENARSADPDPVSSWTHIAGRIWIAGITVLACYTVISFIRIKRSVSVSVCREDKVYICDDIASSFILGVFRPRIYMPSGLSDKTVSHILAHEKTHITRKDHWWKPLGFALLMVYWFNPLVWIAYILFCRDIELACDEKVIKNLKNTGRAEYSKALLSCSVTRRMVSACPVAFGETDVKGRVKSVLNYKKPAFYVILGAAVICAVLAVCFLTDPSESSGKNITSMSQPPVMTVSCGNNTIEVKKSGSSWTTKNRFGGGSSVTEDSPGLLNEAFRSGLQNAGEYGNPIRLSFSVWPDQIEATLISESDLLSTGSSAEEPLTINDDHELIIVREKQPVIFNNNVRSDHISSETMESISVSFNVVRITDYKDSSDIENGSDTCYVRIHALWDQENGNGGYADYYFILH